MFPQGLSPSSEPSWQGLAPDVKVDTARRGTMCTTIGVTANAKPFLLICELIHFLYRVYGGCVCDVISEQYSENNYVKKNHGKLVMTDSVPMS